MQNRAFHLRWTSAALAIAAIVGLSATDPSHAASISNPAAAAIASAGGGAVTAQAGTGAATPAAAGGTPTAATTPPVETAQPSRATESSELAVLQSQLALWKAKAEIAKYKAEVKRADDSLVAAPAGATPGAGVASISLAGPMPAGGAAERAPRLAAEAPRLVSLRAFDGHYNAVVDVSGRTMPVQAGDTLDGGWKVVSIDGGGVKLANGKRVRTLRP
ncbi:type IV pilus biogenesis protein PilP [Cupriavidus taiwanensis]|uniref:type IV pilus biogenesis protein PilP n=1 Tax=Cupriavidus taiwanensis TaxID=164546 RepID=UPI0025406053|nr:type IV pilus biogenesis protein PilP [Cupriavidus taiwanensis]MDK3022939.1 type IV pilus biogenesis protein PilP [Cupriavidus taiwanensis]